MTAAELELPIEMVQLKMLLFGCRRGSERWPKPCSKHGMRYSNSVAYEATGSCGRVNSP